MKAALIIPLLCYAGVAMAGPAPSQAEAGAAVCGSLLTEAECTGHRHTLAGLTDPAARQAYLERHAEMLRERAVMCASTPERHALARARYR